MTKSKTLKQQLQEKAAFLCGCYNLTDNQAIEVVKEWIEQKPSDYTVTYVPESRLQPKEFLEKKKLLEEFRTNE